MKSEAQCPICGAESVQVTTHRPFPYWKCVECATAHLHPMPSREFLSAFYEQFHQPDGEGGIFEQYEHRTAADFPKKASIVARLLKSSTPQRARVLDVGCGKGLFVRELQQAGINGEGIDLSRAAIEAGTRDGISGLHSGLLEDRHEWRSCFDAITCWATIEHLLDPRDFLKTARQVLKPGGLLFLDTGVGSDAVDRHAPGHVQWYDSPQHIFVFSRHGLQQLLQEQGFHTVHFDPLFERTLARRLIKQTRNLTLSLAGGALFRLMLGKTAFQRMKEDTKIPFGSLMLVIARVDLQ